MTPEFPITTVTTTEQPGTQAAPDAGAPHALELSQLHSLFAAGGVRAALAELPRVISAMVDVYSVAWQPVDMAGNMQKGRQFAHQLPFAEEGLEHVLKVVAERCSQLEPLVCVPAQFERVISRADTRARGEAVLQDCYAVAIRVTDQFGESGILSAAVDGKSISPERVQLLFCTIAECIRCCTLEVELLESRMETGASAAVVDLAVRVESCATLREACQRLADETKRYTAAQLVAVGVIKRHGSLSRLEAINDSGRVNDEQRQSLEAALNEILMRESLTVYPPDSNVDRHGLKAVECVAETFSAGSVIGAPISDSNGLPIAVWLVAGPEGVPPDPPNIRFLRAASRRAGPTLDLVQRAEKPAWRLALSQHFAKGRQSPVRTVALFLGLAAALFAMPLSFRVKCDCELQPVVRQFVAAPFEGSLETCHVEPGQQVRAGDLLARMDDREINWELAGIDAERQRTTTERNSHLANQEIGAAEISRYDLERLALRERLLRHRSEVLEIRSPIDGVVVSGDLKKSEGIPLARGDQLFEIAPLDRILVEVAIPEADLRHTEVDQQAEVWFDAFPGESWTGPVKRIHPRSEIRDQQHVFIAEVELNNDKGEFRPGMRGTARISTGIKPAGWILLHRPWEAFLLKMGW